jgi:hypothetical protein
MSSVPCIAADYSERLGNMAFTFFLQLLPFTDALLADIPSELDLGNLSFCSSDTDIDEVSSRAKLLH